MPADSHVHTEWSWDAGRGSMARTCARAVSIGLPAIAFTEHVDHTEWLITPEDLAQSDRLQRFATSSGAVAPPQFDAEGYLAAVDDCRERFPELRILTGVELGEPHWHAAAAEELLRGGRFERVLGSLHCLPVGDRFAEPPYLYSKGEASDVVRTYFAEIPRLVAGCDVFEVLAHIDYPLRYWPAELGPCDCALFEDEIRHALRTLAGSGRALEINTRSGLRRDVVQWWREEGGRAITFGSDAHDPTRVAEGFPQAAALAEANGFRPGRHPWDVWFR